MAEDNSEEVDEVDVYSVTVKNQFDFLNQLEGLDEEQLIQKLKLEEDKESRKTKTVGKGTRNRFSNSVSKVGAESTPNKAQKQMKPPVKRPNTNGVANTELNSYTGVQAATEQNRVGRWHGFASQAQFVPKQTAEDSPFRGRDTRNTRGFDRTFVPRGFASRNSRGNFNRLGQAFGSKRGACDQRSNAYGDIDGAQEAAEKQTSEEVSPEMNNFRDANDPEAPPPFPNPDLRLDIKNDGDEKEENGSLDVADDKLSTESKWLTLDEYRALQKPREKPRFNERKPGEGESQKKEKLVPFTRRNSLSIQEREEEELTILYKQPKKQVLNIEWRFTDRSFRGRSFRGGGMREKPLRVDRENGPKGHFRFDEGDREGFPDLGK